MFPAPVRRQRWLCLAAHRGGRYEVPAAQPTARMVVADLSERPEVVLPAAWRTDPARAGWITMDRGQYRAFDSTEYAVDYGTVSQDGRRLAWRDWQIALCDAWLVADTQALPLGSISGQQGVLTIDPDRRVAWDTVWQADPADGLRTKLAKRLLRYWSTRPNPPRGGRRWLVGWATGEDAGTAGRRDGGTMTGDGEATGGRLVLPALYVIDLGPIEGDFPWDSPD